MLKINAGWKRLMAVAAPALVVCGLSATAGRAQAYDPSVPVASPVPSGSGRTEPAYGSTDSYGYTGTEVDARGPGSSDASGSFFGGLPIPPVGFGGTVSVRSQYESNLLRIPDSLPTPPGQQKHDFRVTPLISGNLNMPLGRQSLYATGVFGKDYYATNTNYNRGRILGSVGANLAAGSSCRGNISANYINQQSSANSSQLNLPNKQVTKSYGASASCGAGVGFTPSISYRHSSARNSLLARQGLDLDNDALTLSVGYSRPTLGQLSVFGSRSYNRYPFQLPNPDGSTYGVDITNLGVSYARNFGPRFAFDGRLFKSNINPTTPGLASTGGTGYALTGSYSPGTKYTLSVNLSRNASASPNVNALFFVTKAYGASLQYRLRPSLGLTASAHSSTRSYHGGGVGLPTQSSDKVLQYRASIDWTSAGGHLGGSLFVTQQNRSGQQSTLILNSDYTNTMAGLNLKYSL